MQKVKDYNEFRHRRRTIKRATIFLIAVFCILTTGFFLRGYAPKIVGLMRQPAGSDLSGLAALVIQNCAGADHRQNCYDKEIPRLMDKISMEDAFRVTRLIQKLDSGYWYCHVLGHEIAAAETKKNPDQWKDVVARCPSGMCSNGCIHGAFQERFRAEALPGVAVGDITKQLENICEPRPGWQPTGLERGTCYHALGHLLMYVTAADIKKSLALCSDLAKTAAGDFTQLCFDGAFMQIFQPLEPEDIALVKGKQPAKDELSAFCRAFPDRQRGSCWTEGWPLYLDDIVRPGGVAGFCDALSHAPAEQERCYTALFYVIPAEFRFDLTKISQYCALLPERRMGSCYANAASRLIETDWALTKSAIQLCQEAGLRQRQAEENCYGALASFAAYTFRVDSPEALDLCRRLPDPWRNQCLRRNNPGEMP